MIVMNLMLSLSFQLEHSTERAVFRQWAPKIKPLYEIKVWKGNGVGRVVGALGSGPGFSGSMLS